MDTGRVHKENTNYIAKGQHSVPHCKRCMTCLLKSGICQMERKALGSINQVWKVYNVYE